MKKYVYMSSTRMLYLFDGPKDIWRKLKKHSQNTTSGAKYTPAVVLALNYMIAVERYGKSTKGKFIII